MYRESYHKAINSVLGTPKNTDQYYEMAERFKLNTARIAAYKSHYATNSLKTLYKEAPKDFVENNKAVLKTFNRWQATEYNTATARCRSAKQFEQFRKEKDLYPNLEWLATRSSTPRELHAGFVGTILPQDDPFWQENQPGNLYNCKCDWRSTDSKITSHPEGSVPPSPGLEGNPATTGEVFSDKHPYYKKATATDDVNEFYIKDVLPDNRINIREWAKENLLSTVISDVPEVGTVGFSVKGIKEFINQPHAQIIEKNVALFKIEELLKTATYVKCVEDVNAPLINRFHYLEIILKNKKSWIILKETNHNKKITLYAMVDAIKKGN